MTSETQTLKKQKLRNNEYYSIQDVFDKLYKQSKNGKVFKNLYKIIVSDENIMLAYRNIKKNKGGKTSGTNKHNIIDIGNKEPQKLINYVKVRLGNFKPHSVRRVEIDKDDGRKRPLGIPTIEDRLIQQCIKQVLEPICEAKFYKHSYGFRPNRGTHHAIARSLFLMNISKYHYVVDVDIKGFFDNVNHGKLLKQMYSLGIRDKRLLCIISKMLKAEIKGIGVPTKGVPQGGILSPLLSNIVLNELDWWIASQWENMPTKRQYCQSIRKNGSINDGERLASLRRISKLKPCFIVRYADDFKIFCNNINHAKRLLAATSDWLEKRLGLSINTEKSKIVNLKKDYSEFLGLKFKLHRKSNKWIVKSHIRDKAIKKIQNKIKDNIKVIQRGEKQGKATKFNATVLGLHNYYKVATNVNLDFKRIAFNVNKSLKNRLSGKHKSKGNKSLAFHKYYGDYKGKIYYIEGMALFPVSKVRTKPPMCFSQNICNYTSEGRLIIHNSLKGISQKVLHYMLDNPIRGQSIEYNDNRISLYVGQNGKCAVTKEPLELGSMQAHHKTPKYAGGLDNYNNLIFLNVDVHRLIHVKDEVLISKYLEKLKLTNYSLSKLNKLRDLIGNRKIELK